MAAPGARRPPGEDPITIAGLVFETGAGLRRRATTSIERDHSLPPQSLEVLIRLARSPGERLRMADLAAQTALTPSGLTRAVDRLTCAGLARREACSSDRRGAFAALTAEGHDMMASVIAWHTEQLEAIFEGLFEPGERAQLAGLLERLRDRVNPGAARLSDGGCCPGA
ncbi:MAG: MarR family winged helix-turn-helix transcriptional regulator [Acidimicrobiales bacterium]